MDKKYCAIVAHISYCATVAQSCKLNQTLAAAAVTGFTKFRILNLLYKKIPLKYLF